MTALTPRARARAETLERIKELAREQMGAEGVAALSLRSLAREIGVTSSAIYRYYASRNDLLTALITDAWAGIGDLLEATDAALPADDVTGRFRASAHALRRWALDHPVDFALLYGQPVPGYVAPGPTRVAAARGWTGLVGSLHRAGELDLLRPGLTAVPVPAALSRQIAGWQHRNGSRLPDPVAATVLAAWGQVLGLLGLEVYGHLDAALGGAGELFTWTVDRLVEQIFVPAG